MKIKICVLLILLSASAGVHAQENYPQPVEIGEPLPNSTVLPYYKQPFVILDFWGTWCKSCIAPFMKLDSLQQQYADSLQIVLLNTKPLSGDSPEKARKFLQEFKAKHPDFDLPLLIDTSWAWRYAFPVRYVPHYVWLDRNRCVIALTGSDEVNANTIEGLFEGRLPHPMKLDRKNFSPKH